MSETLRTLGEQLKAAGSLPAELIGDAPADAQLVTNSVLSGTYKQLVEAVREGFLLHYEEGRIIDSSNADTALLAGDLLYAHGLGQLAELEDLSSIAVLSELIARCAEERAGGAPEAAESAWKQAVLDLKPDSDADEDGATAPESTQMP